MGSVEDDEGEQPNAKQEYRKIIPQVEIGSKRLSQTEWAAVRLGQPFLGDASVISIIILDLLDFFGADGFAVADKGALTTRSSFVEPTTKWISCGVRNHLIDIRTTGGYSINPSFCGDPSGGNQLGESFEHEIDEFIVIYVEFILFIAPRSHRESPSSKVARNSGLDFGQGNCRYSPSCHP